MVVKMKEVLTKIKKNSFLLRLIFVLIYSFLIFPIIFLTPNTGLFGKILGFSFWFLISNIVSYELILATKFNLIYKIQFFILNLFFWGLFYKEFIILFDESYEINIPIIKIINEQFLADRWIVFTRVGLFMGIATFFVFQYFINKQKNIKIQIAEFFAILFAVLIVPFIIKWIYVFNLSWHQGVVLIFFIVLSTSSVDFMGLVGGMFLGHTIFTKKFCPKISPKKTWEGAIAGYLFGIAFSIAFLFIFNVFPNTALWFKIIIILLLPFFAIIGDLFFSWLKRGLKIKDFSQLIPGHGGFLDRLDSTIFVCSFLLIFLNLL